MEIEIDHVLASGAMVGHATTHSHPTTAPDAKMWSIPKTIIQMMAWLITWANSDPDLCQSYGYNQLQLTLYSSLGHIHTSPGVNKNCHGCNAISSWNNWNLVICGKMYYADKLNIYHGTQNWLWNNHGWRTLSNIFIWILMLFLMYE